MRRLVLIGALLALVLPASAAADVELKGLDATSYPTMRATLVSSAGAASAPVLRENGQAVVGLDAQNLGNTKAVVLGVDRSQSMRGKPLADAAAAARSFLASKSPGDEVSVVAFGDGAVALTRPSNSSLNANDALASLTVDEKQGTSLYDAVLVASRQLGAEHLPGRILILLTDGHDAGSDASLEDAVEAARRSGVAVYTIGIVGDGFTPDALQRLSDATGGRYYAAQSTSDLGAVYASVASELKRTWRVEYITSAGPGDRIKLEAAVVGAGTTKASYTLPTDGFDVSKPKRPSKLIPKGAYGPGGPLAIGVAVAVLLFVAGFLLFAAARGSWVRTRIAAHVGETKASSKEKRREQRLAALAAIFRATESALGNLRHWRAIQRMLERADLPLRTVEFFWMLVGSAVVVGLLMALTGQAPLVIVVGMAVGGSIPFLVVWFKMRRRLRAFEDQLPDVLITIAASLKAGHSFKQGLQAVVDEGQPPASAEFKRVLTETSLGKPMDEALGDMAERCGSKNFEFAITAVTIQRQVGGSLASLFDMVADTVRQRQQFARKIRSLTAMGRMSAYTLAGIPFFLAAAITFLNPGYISPMYHSHTGHILVFVGLTMMALGSAILKKIVSFRG